MTHLICPIGVPGCGKSTLAAELVSAGLLPTEAVVSPDDYRVALTGKRGDLTADGDAFAITTRITKARLSRGLDVFYDATHLSERARTAVVTIAQEHGVDLVWVLFGAVAEAMVRNEERPDETRVPLEVMARMGLSLYQLDRETLLDTGFVVLPENLELFLAEVDGGPSSDGATVRSMN